MKPNEPHRNERKWLDQRFYDSVFGISLQEPPDLAFQLSAVQCALALVDPSAKGVRPFFDTLGEPFMHRLSALCGSPKVWGGRYNYNLTQAMSTGVSGCFLRRCSRWARGLRRQEVLISNNNDEFVNKIVRLCINEKLWASVQSAAQTYIQQHRSPESMKRKLAEILTN